MINATRIERCEREALLTGGPAFARLRNPTVDSYEQRPRSKSRGGAFVFPAVVLFPSRHRSVSVAAAVAALFSLHAFSSFPFSCNRYCCRCRFSSFFAMSGSSSSSTSSSRPSLSQSRVAVAVSPSLLAASGRCIFSRQGRHRSSKARPFREFSLKRYVVSLRDNALSFRGFKRTPKR